MATLAPLDWAILGVLLVTAGLAFLHGLLVEICSLAGLIAGVLVAGRYYPQVAPWTARLVHSPAAARATAFLLLALAVMLAAGILGRVLRWMLRRVGLGWADRLAGGAFGLVKGYVLVALGLAATVAFFPKEPWLAQSQLVPYFIPGAHGSVTVLPRDLGVRIQSGLHRLEQVVHSEASGTGPAVLK